MIVELGRLTRFCLVGVSNTLVTLATFAALSAIGVAAAPAAALGFGAGAANGYRLNRRWTFRIHTTGWRTLARYLAVQLLGAGLSAGGVALATEDLSLRRLAAEALVLPAVTLVTYVLSRQLVFRSPEPA
jgi:putative flippase GtrA